MSMLIASRKAARQQKNRPGGTVLRRVRRKKEGLFTSRLAGVRIAGYGILRQLVAELVQTARAARRAIVFRFAVSSGHG